MPLKLIHGPPNSGKRGAIRRGFADVLDRDPLLVVPTADDVFSFERELCEGGAALGGAAITFGALFRTVLASGGRPAAAELSAAQRLRLVEVAIASCRNRLGPLRRAAERSGFAAALELLLDELQAGGVEPAAVGVGAATLESSAYLGDLATLFAAYEEVRAGSGRVDSHGMAREAISLLRADPAFWSGRPVFLYGLDDLTANQLELVAALSSAAEVTVALPFEEGNAALAARGRLIGQLRERVGVAEEAALEADPANTGSPLLFGLARGFGRAAAGGLAAGPDLTLLRCAGVRGEAEAVALEVSRLIQGGADPAEIAITVRDPARRGPALAAGLEANGIAVALEAELPVAGTGVGGALIALLEAEFGSRRAADLMRYLRGPSGLRAGRVDWLERALRRGRVQDARSALAIWQGEDGEPPRDLERLRAAAERSAAASAAEVGELAATMAARPLRSEQDGPRPGAHEAVELRAAAAISTALGELAELGDLAPAPAELAATVSALRFRVWSGPVEGRVRIASPYRLRAGRFDHVLVASLQDSEFPRRDGGGDPFLSDRQREALGLEPRRDAEAEERYLFGVCLSLPRQRLFLSHRQSDEDGGAESPSPLLDDVRALLSPPRQPPEPDPVEEEIVRSWDLARVVGPLAEAPSEDELARALAAHGRDADPAALLGAVGVGGELAGRLGERIAAARRAEAASRAPGPLANPAVLESLAGVAAYGGTTLEEFDLCSYRWFVGHELDPQPLDPTPDPLVQGGLMHEALERLYRERPGGDPLPRPGSLRDWQARGRELVAAIAAERELGERPAERAMARRVERLLERFLAEESERDAGGFTPWLLEARFGEQPDAERPVLDLGGWGLHGAVDRVDRDAEGRAVVLDYKLSGAVTPRERFEERAKLQLPLYLLAVERHWGAAALAGLYHPLRATSVRRPRGVVADDLAGPLAGYDLYDNDVIEAGELEELLEDSRRRAGEIVARIRAGGIRRDPGPRPGLRGHDVCPAFCSFATICRRDRAPRHEEDEGAEER